ncbi:hypothetical protein [Haliovirga abyssi]|uniref:Uncharacterized protein n=1 Tax=Haliovirga abyssi TaxID=2996794 RepID=A0AAU9DRA0_9FUSO|nr:hypothetical protein [Haliovirga abyssi]BDU49449.1 hypothetical protein HLVA_00180 [Haliovirga abyssi]
MKLSLYPLNNIAKQIINTKEYLDYELKYLILDENEEFVGEVETGKEIKNVIMKSDIILFTDVDNKEREDNIIKIMLEANKQNKDIILLELPTSEKIKTLIKDNNIDVLTCFEGKKDIVKYIGEYLNFEENFRKRGYVGKGEKIKKIGFFEISEKQESLKILLELNEKLKEHYNIGNIVNEKIGFLYDFKQLKNIYENYNLNWQYVEAMFREFEKEKKELIFIEEKLSFPIYDNDIHDFMKKNSKLLGYRLDEAVLIIDELNEKFINKLSNMFRIYYGLEEILACIIEKSFYYENKKSIDNITAKYNIKNVIFKDELEKFEKILLLEKLEERLENKYKKMSDRYYEFKNA